MCPRIFILEMTDVVQDDLESHFQTSREEQLMEDEKHSMKHVADKSVDEEPALGDLQNKEPTMEDFPNDHDETRDEENSNQQFFGFDCNETDLDGVKFNEFVYPGCPLSVGSSALLLMLFVLKHKLTMKAAADLVNLLVAHFPSDHRGLTSLYRSINFCVSFN